MSIPALTETAIRRGASAESFRRGEEYYEGGAVTSAVRRGDTIQAEVDGSQYEPYRVSIAFDQAGVTAASCSCPYDWGGWCKHIVATLLLCLNEPGEIEERPPLADLLAGLNADRLVALIVALAEEDPDLVDAIESQIEILRAIAPTAAPAIAAALSSAPVAPPPPPRHTPVDPEPFRKQVRRILSSLDGMRRSEAYWHVGEVVNQIGSLVAQAQTLIQAGDGRNAIAILAAITGEYMEQWVGLDDSDGEASGFFTELTDPWTEAILAADPSTSSGQALTPDERRQWAAKLAAWQADLSEYGVEDVFDAAILAAEQGWDYPPLARALAGEITDLGAWEDEDVPACADDLTLARLRILERQGRTEEYLHLAEAEGQTGLYVAMLARVGRTEQAVEEGLEFLSQTDDVFMLAQALRERGELDAALQIAAHGLKVEGAKSALANWTADLAAGLGDLTRALDAVVIAFRETPTLAGYQKVQGLAGLGWPALQTELLTFLRQARDYFYTDARVDIFLHEGLLDDAIAVVDKTAGYAAIGRVMDAALEKRPDWVSSAARKQADRIMDAGKANQYDYAIGWLTRARAAYRAAGRERDWQTYLARIRDQHGRKYKLMGLIDGMGK